MKNKEITKIDFKCVKPLAFDSPDHIEPHGTRRDNSRNISFNKKLYNLFGETTRINVLDLGCSGGGFVKDCIDDGNFAVGIDGSDYSKKNKRAEWRTIPDNLFTADITKPFAFYDQDGERILFDVITLWDVIEHIKQSSLKGLFRNLKENLSSKGIIIMSVGCVPDVINGVELHQTVKEPEWWLNEFIVNKFKIINEYEDYFGNCYIKGKKKYDSGFNVVLTKKFNFTPLAPKRTRIEKMFDVWSGSKIQLAISKIINGYSTQ